MSMTDNDELRERIRELEDEVAELRGGFEETIEDYNDSDSRVDELESLVREMIVTLNSYSALLAIILDAENTEKCNAIVDEYNERMKELGIEVVGA